jgi:hypothetical protein
VIEAGSLVEYSLVGHLLDFQNFSSASDVLYRTESCRIVTTADGSGGFPWRDPTISRSPTCRNSQIETLSHSPTPAWYPIAVTDSITIDGMVHEWCQMRAGANVRLLVARYPMIIILSLISGCEILIDVVGTFGGANESLRFTSTGHRQMS